MFFCGIYRCRLFVVIACILFICIVNGLVLYMTLPDFIEGKYDKCEHHHLTIMGIIFGAAGMVAFSFTCLILLCCKMKCGNKCCKVFLCLLMVIFMLSMFGYLAAICFWIFYLPMRNFDDKSTNMDDICTHLELDAIAAAFCCVHMACVFLIAGIIWHLTTYMKFHSMDYMERVEKDKKRHKCLAAKYFFFHLGAFMAMQVFGLELGLMAKLSCASDSRKSVLHFVLLGLAGFLLVIGFFYFLFVLCKKRTFGCAIHHPIVCPFLCAVICIGVPLGGDMFGFLLTFYEDPEANKGVDKGNPNLLFGGASPVPNQKGTCYLDDLYKFASIWYLSGAFVLMITVPFHLAFLIYDISHERPAYNERKSKGPADSDDKASMHVLSGGSSGSARAITVRSSSSSFTMSVAGSSRSSSSNPPSGVSFSQNSTASPKDKGKRVRIQRRKRQRKRRRKRKSTSKSSSASSND